MKNYFCIGFLSFIFLLSFREKKVEDASGTFTALNYNVAGLPSGISSSQPLIYKVLISPKLNNFDIVHVQEDF